MRSTLIDSNVLIDLFDETSEWQGWSETMVAECRDRGHDRRPQKSPPVHVCGAHCHLIPSG